MEIAAREMDSRLLIALHVAAAGADVVFGQKWVLQKNIEVCPRGSWLFKTLTPGDAGPMQRAKAAGHMVCAIDEEVPGLGEGCGGLRWVAPQSLENCDLVFCLGEAHREAMTEKFPKHAGKYVITGNPRWDLLRPELRAYYAGQAEAIRREHGRFVLYNTNSGLTNSAKAPAEKLIRALYRDGRLNENDPKDRAFIADVKKFEAANIAAAPRIVRRLAESFPGERFILRPHPTEKAKTYAAQLAGLENVSLISGGPAVPWLMAAELLIHTSCTTANEAFALGTPSICFEATESPLNDSYFFSAQVSRRTASLDDVSAWSGDVLAGNIDPALWRSKDMRQAFARFFAAQEGDFAARRIAGEILAHGPQADAGHWRRPRGFRRRRLWRKAFQRRIFPDFPRRELQDRLARLARLSGLPMPRLRKIGQALYHIAPAD